MQQERRQIVEEMDAALERMRGRWGAENPHCRSLQAKRDAVAAGAAFVVTDATADTLRAVGSMIGRLTRTSRLRQHVLA
jgi:hypothetical protein